MATPKKEETTRRRMPLSGLDPQDIDTLTFLVTAQIQAGRKSDMTDAELARLFALQAKLAKIAETRTPPPTPAKV